MERATSLKVRKRDTRVLPLDASVVQGNPHRLAAASEIEVDELDSPASHSDRANNDVTSRDGFATRNEKLPSLHSKWLEHKL